jgi:tRNA pseudouridine55 synthase
MRSIAHDLGQALGCGALLAELRRMASGEFELAQARTIPQLESLAADERLLDALTPAGQNGCPASSWTTLPRRRSATGP